MKALLALIFVACSAPVGERPDASVTLDAGVQRDANPDAQAIDAAPPRKKGCDMALPESRDLTIALGDPVPPELLNRLQDMNVGDRQTERLRQSFPACWVDIGSTSGVTPPVLVQAPGSGLVPVWRFTTDAGNKLNNFWGRINVDSDQVVVGAAIEVYGDGVVDWSAGIGYYPLGDVGGGSLIAGTNTVEGSGVSNQAAAWSAFELTTDGDVAIPENAVVWVNIQLAATGASQVLHVGDVYLRYRR